MRKSMHGMHGIKSIYFIAIFYFLVQTAFAHTAPTNPTVSLSTRGTAVNISWSADNADTYILYVAPYPDASFIYDIDMGALTSVSIDLPTGSAYYVSVRASNSMGMSDWSNIEYFDLTESSGASNPLIGSWLCDTDGLENSAVLTFMDDIHYMFAVDGEPDDGGGRGMERGTYTWDASSGAFSAVALSNTAGDWGVASMAESTETVYISGETLNFTQTGEELIQFTKIE